MVNTKFEYNQLIDRNRILINTDLQRKIKEERILLLGCGLGSQIGILAARTGFENFILCDGDLVELTNINRQNFEIADIGYNKAMVLKDKILAINPKCNIRTISTYVKTTDMVQELISQSDIVVNMVDPDEIIYDINECAISNQKPVFFPVNFAFGAYLIIFTSKSASLTDLIGDEKITGNEFFSRLVLNSLKHINNTVPSDNFEKYRKIYQESLKPDGNIPQLGMSAAITSSIVIKNIIKWLNRANLTIAPEPILVDPWIN